MSCCKPINESTRTIRRSRSRSRSRERYGSNGGAAAPTPDRRRDRYDPNDRRNNGGMFSPQPINAASVLQQQLLQLRVNPNDLEEKKPNAKAALARLGRVLTTIYDKPVDANPMFFELLNHGGYSYDMADGKPHRHSTCGRFRPGKDEETIEEAHCICEDASEDPCDVRSKHNEETEDDLKEPCDECHYFEHSKTCSKIAAIHTIATARVVASINGAPVDENYSTCLQIMHNPEVASTLIDTSPAGIEKWIKECKSVDKF